MAVRFRDPVVKTSSDGVGFRPESEADVGLMGGRRRGVHQDFEGT